MECTRHFLKYYSAVNRSEALTPALMWRDPEDTVLSETSGHRRTHTAGCHSQEVPRVTEPERQEEDGGARAVLNGRSFGLRTWKVLEMDGGDSGTAM
jgi:hypothetical protein